MKKTTLALIWFFMSIALMGYTTAINAQSVKQDATGNYYAEKAAKDTTISYKATGKTFTDNSGKVWPVYVSKNGKLFVIRTSAKTGNTYKQYLKL